MGLGKELVGFQLTLLDELGKTEMVPRFSDGDPRKPYLRLSQSRLELLAQALDNPDLDDRRLALPKTGNREVSAGARKTIYEIIAEKTLKEAEIKPPFAGTKPMFDPDEGLEFPRPEIFNAAWQKFGGDLRIGEFTRALFQRDESLAVLPVDYGRTGQLGAASELRVSGLDHQDAVIWSGRLDTITRATDYSGKTVIEVVDYKSGQEKNKPITEIQDNAGKSAAFMTAQLAINLPKIVSDRRRAVRVTLQPRRIPKNIEFKLTHLVFSAGIMQPHDVLAEIGEDWHSPRQAMLARERLGDLTAAIRANADRLAPVLK